MGHPHELQTTPHLGISILPAALQQTVTPITVTPYLGTNGYQMLTSYGLLTTE